MSESVDGIYFFNIPIPPSANAQYATILRNGKTRRVPSKEMRDYDKVFEIWVLQNKHSLNEARKQIIEWNSPLEVAFFLVLKRDKILTKDGRMKKLDVSNRSKSLHDKLAGALGIDDCYFISCPMEKVLADICSEQVIVSIRPVNLRSISEIDLFRKDLGPEEIETIEKNPEVRDRLAKS